MNRNLIDFLGRWGNCKTIKKFMNIIYGCSPVWCSLFEKVPRVLLKVDTVQVISSAGEPGLGRL